MTKTSSIKELKFYANVPASTMINIPVIECLALRVRGILGSPGTRWHNHGDIIAMERLDDLQWHS